MSSITNQPPPSFSYSSYGQSTYTSSPSAPLAGGEGQNTGSVPSIIADDPLLDALFQALTPAQQQEIENMLPQILAAGGGTASGQSSFNNAAASTFSSPPPSSPSTNGAAGTTAPPAQASGSTWSPMGAGPYNVNVTNSSSVPETITLTGNNQTPTSVTLGAGQSMNINLPANYAGNISAQKQGEAGGPPTLFEFSTGNGQGSNTSWDISTIVGDNTDMHATAAGSSDVADSQSNTPGSHYIHWNDDQQRPSPVKNTTGTSMSLTIS